MEETIAAISLFSFSLFSRAEAGGDDMDWKTGAERVSPERTDNEVMGDNSSALQVTRSCKYSPADRFLETAAASSQSSSAAARLMGRVQVEMETHVSGVGHPAGLNVHVRRLEQKRVCPTQTV